MRDLNELIMSQYSGLFLGSMLKCILPENATKSKKRLTFAFDCPAPADLRKPGHLND
jgi:hypothetical protein